MNVSDAQRQAALASASIQETLADAALAKQTLNIAHEASVESKLATEEQENAAAGIMAKTKKLEPARKAEKVEKAEKVQESILVRKEEADQFAGDFSRRQGNREYHLELANLSLLAQDLGVAITPTMSSDDIIKRVYERLVLTLQAGVSKAPDVSQVDKAFEFLLEVTSKKMDAAKGEEKARLQALSAHIATAKALHFERNAHDIQMAQKIIQIASGVVDESGLTPKEALDTMRTIINNPQDVQTKRKYYEEHGGYPKLIDDAKSLYRVIGENLKRVKIKIANEDDDSANDDDKKIKKPSMPTIENAELARLIDEVKTLQAATRVPLTAKTFARVIERYLLKGGILN